MTEILEEALNAGSLMLSNGSETYRVEGCIKKVLENCNLTSVDISILGTGIIITIYPSSPNEKPITMSKAIAIRSTNLDKISKTTVACDLYAEEKINLSTLSNYLIEIKNKNTYSLSTKIIATCLGTTFFACSISGNISSAVITFLATIIPAIFIHYANKKGASFFIINLTSGFFIAFIAMFASSTTKFFNSEWLIASIIIILTPGVASVNAIRDVVNGDYLSGVSRGVEVLVQALSLSLGVFFALYLWNYIMLGGK